MSDKLQVIEDYIRDRYEVGEILEKLSDYLTMQDSIDIIKEYDLYNIFIEELQEGDEQLELF